MPKEGVKQKTKKKIKLKLNLRKWRYNGMIELLLLLLAELHPRAKRARGRSPIAKEMW